MAAVQETIDKVKEIDVDQYKYGFVTDIESELAPKGLNEDIVAYISAKKKKNRNGCSTGVWMRSVVGKRWKSHMGAS